MVQNYFRIMASAFSVVSYFLMIHGNVAPGAAVNLLCQLLLLPFSIRHRAYDMVGLSALFGGVNVHVLIETWVNSLF